MKHSLLVLFLLAAATPLFANDEGGDGAYIPSYRELVREGYGPQSTYLSVQAPNHGVPKPTQAYYGRGYVIYYNYTIVPAYQNTYRFHPEDLYAFGYPVEYFRSLMPASITDTDLSHYAVAKITHNGTLAPGDYIARSRRDSAVTTVRATANTTTTTTRTSNGEAPLPAIGEKPSH